MTNQPYVPPEGPPRESAPKCFDRIGAEPLHRMSRRQYRKLAQSSIASMFPTAEDELTEAAERQADFLVGVLGGPRIYREKRGEPRMRARHLPFAIDEAARREWLRCFREAFHEEQALGLDPPEQQRLLEWIEAFSGWMVNRAS